MNNNLQKQKSVTQKSRNMNENHEYINRVITVLFAIVMYVCKSVLKAFKVVQILDFFISSEDRDRPNWIFTARVF